MSLAIPGFEGYRLVRSGDSWCVIGKRGTVLRPGRGSDGREQFSLVGSDGRKTTTGLGRIVLLATAGPPPTALHECCHADGDPFNNDPSNLRWGTRSDNAADSVAHGSNNLLRRPRGVGSRSLPPEAIAAVRAAHVPHATRGQRKGTSRTGSVKQLAELHGVSRNVIGRILRGSS